MASPPTQKPLFPEVASFFPVHKDPAAPVLGPATMPAKYVAFDLETTGRDGERDRITEFCFIELDAALAEQGRWSRLVDPGVPVPKEIEELTGITTDMVRGQPPFAAHAPRIQALVAGAVLIAHNHQFDVQFLNRELRMAGQAGIAVGHPCIDTLLIERSVNSHRLGAIYRRYTGVDMEGAHRSEADTAATVEVLRRQRVQHSQTLPSTLHDLVVSTLDRHFGNEKETRNWLDHGHRFYRDGQGTIRFGFGKYRNEPALQHEDYLLWMKGRDFPDETKATIDMILKAKETPVPSSPSPTPIPR